MRRTRSVLGATDEPPLAAAALTETQRRIADAALEAFSERGYDGTTTAEIAHRAGVAEKTIFANFGTKERLYHQTLGPAAFELFVPEAMRTMRVLLEGAEPSLEGFLRAVMKNRVSFIGKQPSKLKLSVQEVLLRPALLPSFVERWRTTVVPAALAVLERLRERGELRPLPPALVIRALISLTAGYVVMRFILWPQGDWDDDAEIDATIDVLVNGLRPRGKQQRS